MRLVNEILLEAIESRASDVHIESQQSGLRIRYRIDGVLHAQPDAAGDQPLPGGHHQPLEDHVAAEHRRAPPAAGRPHPVADRRPRGRYPRVGHPDDPRRRASCCGCWTRAPWSSRSSKLGMEDDLYATFQRADPPAARHHPGDRPDRLRQEHHALQRAVGDQERRDEDHHHRRPGRVPAGRHQPDPGASEDRPDVRQLAAEHSAARPGHHPRRRNPRPGNGRKRHPGVADRPPGLQHAAHQRRGRGLHAAGRHGRRAVPGLQHGRGGDGPAAGAHACARTARSRTTRQPDELPPDFPRDQLPPGTPLYRPVGCRECRQVGYRGRVGLFELLVTTEEIRQLVARPRQQLGHPAGGRPRRACARSARTAGAKCSPAARRSTKCCA